MGWNFIDGPFIENQLTDGKGGPTFVDGRLDSQTGTKLETLLGFKTDFTTANPTDFAQKSPGCPFV